MPSGGHARAGRLPQPGSGRSLTRPGARSGAPRRLPVMAAAPDPPGFLSAEELEVWRYYAPKLAADGRLSDKSVDVLARYCFAVVQVRRLAQVVRESAPVILSTQYQPDGTTREIAKTNPADAMLRSWLDKCRALENDLLLNPAALLRVPAEQPTEDDPFADEPSA